MTWFHYPKNGLEEKVFEQLLLINQKLHKMNEKAAELAADVAQLKTDYETIKAQNAAIIQALKDKVGAGGATAEELQVIIDSTNSLDAEVKGDIAAGADVAQPAAVAPTATAQ